MGQILQSIEVTAPIENCYTLWTDFENFPSFMNHVKQVHYVGDTNILHWKVQGPLGKTLEWDAEIVELEPNRLVSWRSLPHTGINSSGTIIFSQKDPHTVKIDVSMMYETPAGAMGEFIADTLYHPRDMVREDLANFKKIVETRLLDLNVLPGGRPLKDKSEPPEPDRSRGGLYREKQGGNFSPGELPNDI